MKRLLYVIGLLVLYPFHSLPAVDQLQREKFLSEVMFRGLEGWHYAPQKIDDAFSTQAFREFVSRLDQTKSFLIQADIEALNPFTNRIDDQILVGSFDLAKLGARLLRQRITSVQDICRDVLKAPFDFSGSESIELDPEKRDFCRTLSELRGWWVKQLRYMALMRYLDLQKAAAKEGKEEKKNGISIVFEWERQARQAVLKSMERLFQRMLQERPDEADSRYLNALAAVFDPHSLYYPPRDKEDFDIEMSGTLEGIGVLLSESEGKIKVLDVVPGGPAWTQNQIKVEDIILKVGQGREEPVDIVGMTVSDVARLIRGPKGTDVHLTVRKPDGRMLSLALVRNIVEIQETYARSAVLLPENPGRKYGYIFLPRFYHDFNRDHGRNSTEDVRKELEKLKQQQVDGIILDLRNNGGGALDDAVNMSGLFIENGPIVQVRDRRSGVRIHSDPDPDIVFRGPLVVLVNTLSASASEIVAAALQDYGRAVVIGGGHTFGKGTVQMMVDLDRFLDPRLSDFRPLGALALTIQKFYRITGASTQFRGVIPDIVLPESSSYLEVGEQFLDHPLPWDTVSAVSFPKWEGTRIDVAAIRNRSDQRVKSNPRFNRIAQYLESLGRRRKQTRLSLNLADFKQEQEILWRESDAYTKLLSDSAGIKPVDYQKNSRTGSAAAPVEEEKRVRWLKDLQKDYFIEEAVDVLFDLAGSPGEPQLQK